MPFKDPEKRRQYNKQYHANWYAQNAEERKTQINQRRKERRAQAFALLGNKCASCHDTNGPFDIDHIAPQWAHRQPAEKLGSYQIGLLSDEDLLAELELCQLLCRACHKLKTQQDLKLYWENKRLEECN
jgi:hypothetical protein